MILIWIEIRIWNCFPPDCTTNGNIFRMHLLLIPNRGSALAIIANCLGRACQTITSISIRPRPAITSFSLVSNYVTLRFNDRTISQWLAVRHAWPKGAWQLQFDICPDALLINSHSQMRLAPPYQPCHAYTLPPTQPIRELINAFEKMAAEIAELQ